MYSHIYTLPNYPTSLCDFHGNIYLNNQYFSVFQTERSKTLAYLFQINDPFSQIDVITIQTYDLFYLMNLIRIIQMF